MANSAGTNGDAESSEAVNADESVVVVPDGTIAVPAALEVTNPQLELTEEQERQKQKLGDDFVAAIDGVSPDSGDPDYRDKYSEAQRENDDRFYALFGHDAFLAQQQQTNVESSKLQEE